MSSGWSRLCEFPALGGNALRLMLQAFAGEQPLLPGQPLAARLTKHLERLAGVIEWALGRNVHVIIAFNLRTAVDASGPAIL